MTNTVAISLMMMILVALIINFAMGWDAHIFLGRKLADAIEWMAFWR